MTSNTLVKICGIQSPEDAILASRSGADLIGMIFAPSSRQITIKSGQQIAQAINNLTPITSNAFDVSTDSKCPKAAPAKLRKLSLEEIADLSKIPQKTKEGDVDAAAGAASSTRESTNQSELELAWFIEHKRMLENAITNSSHKSEESQRITTTTQQQQPFNNRRPLLVGVFQNQPIEVVIETSRQVPLDIVQLHGDETPEYIDKITEWPVIKVFHIDKDAKQVNIHDQIKSLIEPFHHAFILLDTKVKGAAHQGGKGVSFDWNIAREIVQHSGGIPIIMAGGLTPENVQEAIKIGTPWGVDVSSGVETQQSVKLSYGELKKTKDPQKLCEFIYNAKNANS
ncbi:anthranilate synthase / indole-3-glycerol phosphate synthase [Mycoemilia scoparia]|uniref:N-(5'-phosphoribosyl)anthranilate isomerase n=1 Tax=Mycoemilia scoparia TaxID=417184 RepID=A0A9W8DR35_9FUNG|nr:anthranilate synthase / indole-3-glycerol phosphate synthase [Mycoemilia scoparia]